jgi:hypothetical protein
MNTPHRMMPIMIATRTGVSHQSSFGGEFVDRVEIVTLSNAIGEVPVVNAAAEPVVVGEVGSDVVGSGVVGAFEGSDVVVEIVG